MSKRVSAVKWAALTAMLLLCGSQAVAGDRVRSPSRTATRPQVVSTTTAITHSAPARVSVFVALAPSSAQPSAAPLSVDLRGPDGQTRRFVVEGGPAAIRYEQVVLRPGRSLTIQLVTAK
jgi:hypothetical protein